MNSYPYGINWFWYGTNSFSVWMNMFHMGIHSFWYGMNSFTLPYIHSGPGFPIVLVGTFNKAKDIKAPSLNIVFAKLCWHLYAGPCRGQVIGVCCRMMLCLQAQCVFMTQSTVGQCYLINGVGNTTQKILAIPSIHYVLKLSPARKDKQLLWLLFNIMEGGFSVKRVLMSYLWETQDSGWPSIGACQTVVPRQSSTNFSWKFGVQWTTILWWKVFANHNWELNPGPSAFRAAALPLSYEAGMNLQGTTFEHALLLCELLVTLTAAGFAFKTGIFSHAAFE